MLQTGASFAGYHLEGVLGQGGMGTVYLAKHPRLPRSVALKVLNREFSADHELQRRFEREADVVAQLDHPGIVGIFDRGTDDGYLWIAMQCVRGTDAATWDARAYPADVTARLIGETASALDYANQHGVLHRDVKPGNIVIADPEHGRDIRAILTDFGIARVATANTQLTATGTFTATLAYASPEQLSGEVVDHRSDQYSLACTLFAMYAGHPPYTATNPGQVVAGHLSQPVPRLTALRPDLPPAVDAVIARAMAKRRDERFSSATEFTTAVSDALEGRHVAAPLPSPSPQPHVSDGHAWQPGPDGAYPAHSSGGHVRQSWSAPGQHAPADNYGQQRSGRTPRPGDAFGGYQPSGMDYAAPVGTPWRPPVAAVNPWNAHGPAPSKATAVFAGVMTLVAGLGVLLFLIYGITETRAEIDRGDDPAGSFIAIGVILCVLAFTTAGGVLILCARTAGRVMSIIAAVPLVILALVAVVGSATSAYYGTTAGAAVGFVLEVAVIACAASRSTGNWIRHHKTRRAARW